MTNSPHVAGWRPLLRVLARVRPDGRLGQILGGDVGWVEDDAGIEGQESVRRREQRVDVELGDGGLLHYQLAEAYEQLLETGHIDAGLTADALEGGVDLGPLHHPTRQGRRQGWQAQGAVLEDLHEGAAKAEEEHRAELRIDAASEDQLVAIAFDHGLDGHTPEVGGAVLLVDRRLDAGEGVPDRIRIGEVEPHAADVGLVRDRVARRA